MPNNFGYRQDRITPRISIQETRLSTTFYSIQATTRISDSFSSLCRFHPFSHFSIHSDKQIQWIPTLKPTNSIDVTPCRALEVLEPQTGAITTMKRRLTVLLQKTQTLRIHTIEEIVATVATLLRHLFSHTFQHRPQQTVISYHRCKIFNLVKILYHYNRLEYRHKYPLI